MIKKLLIILLLLLTLITPKTLLEGAKCGLDLWLTALIPALLPFMIISNYIMSYDLANLVNVLMRPLTFILKLEKEAGYAIFSGIFFGYPSCAVTCTNLYKSGRLDQKSANICICAFNNVSPAFISGYIGCAICSNKTQLMLIFANVYLTILINAFVVRFLFFTGKTNEKTVRNNVRPNLPGFNDIIQKSLINILKIGIYVFIFCIIGAYIKKLTPVPCYFLEVTTALMLSGKDSLRFLPCITSFGGICGIFQTFAVDDGKIIDRKKYCLAKLSAMAISFVLVILL